MELMDILQKIIDIAIIIAVTVLIDKIIDKYYSVLAKQSSINNDNLTSEQISKLKDEIAVDKIGLPEDIINYFNLYAEVNSPTVRQVGSYDYYFDRRRELKDKVSKIYQNAPISLYGRSEVKVDSSIKRELDYIDDILATYDKLKDNSHCYIFINGRNIAELQTEAEKVRI